MTRTSRDEQGVPTPAVGSSDVRRRARTPPWFGALLCLAGCVLGTLALCLSDRRASKAGLVLKSWDTWVRNGAFVRIPGLWPASRVRVRLLVRASRPPLTMEVHIKDERVTARLVSRRPRQIVLWGLTDRSGTLEMRLVSPMKGHGHPRLIRVLLDLPGRGRVPWERALQYLCLTLFACGFGAWAGAGWKWGLLGVAVGVAAVSVVLLEDRVQTLLLLPRGLLLAGLAAGMAALATRGLGMPRPAAALISTVFLLRSLASMHPVFPAIDATFHSDNAESFNAGKLITSWAPSPRPGEPALQVPYPPAFYALLRPVSGLRLPSQTAVRMAMALLEGTAPLLVFCLVRACGASLAAASWGAMIHVAMPEQLLVLAKGIAANITGSWASLLALLAAVRGVGFVTLVAVFALAFLSHLGGAACLGVLLVAWAAQGIRRQDWPWRRVGALLGAAVLGMVAAWFLYYREVAPVASSAAGALGSELGRDAGEFFHVRWVRVGKLLQDLVLKFGLVPIGVAWSGLRSLGPSDRLRGLLVPWFWSGAALGLLAIASPIPLRFEYFLLPAVAAAAGVGAERLTPGWRAFALAVPLGIQVALALLLLGQRFKLISVIMESKQWPFPPFWI